MTEKIICDNCTDKGHCPEYKTGAVCVNDRTGRKDDKMTICKLRKKYPCHDFYFFKDGYEIRKSPFYHAEIKAFEVINADTIFVYM